MPGRSVGGHVVGLQEEEDHVELWVVVSKEGGRVTTVTPYLFL